MVVRTPDAATAACTSCRKAAWLVTASPYGASDAKSTPCCASEGDATIRGVKRGFKARVGFCGVRLVARRVGHAQLRYQQAAGACVSAGAEGREQQLRRESSASRVRCEPLAGAPLIAPSSASCRRASFSATSSRSPNASNSSHDAEQLRSN